MKNLSIVNKSFFRTFLVKKRRQISLFMCIYVRILSCIFIPLFLIRGSYKERIREREGICLLSNFKERLWKPVCISCQQTPKKTNNIYSNTSHLT